VSKSRDVKKESKKAPLKSAKEKKAAKKEKQTERNRVEF